MRYENGCPQKLYVCTNNNTGKLRVFEKLADFEKWAKTVKAKDWSYAKFVQEVKP